MTIRLSRLARRDLDDIRDYTLATWGRDRWLDYYRGMVEVFERIAVDPDGGRDRSPFAPGLRSLNYRRHIVFYASIDAAGGEPVILRIVHQRRNLPALVYFEEIGG